MCVCVWVSVGVCVCFCRKLSRARSQHLLKSAETYNASLTQYYLEMKLVDFGLVALLWSYGVNYIRLLTLTAIFRCPESIEEQPAYNGLLFSLVFPSVPQGRQ